MAGSFTSKMPFLSSNQQCQGTLKKLKALTATRKNHSLAHPFSIHELTPYKMEKYNLKKTQNAPEYGNYVHKILEPIHCTLNTVT